MSAKDRTEFCRASSGRASWGRALHWAFDSRESGRITVIQAPNLWAGIAAAAFVAERLVPAKGAARPVFRGARAASLTVWALDEITRGVNPWRRSLGGGALVGQAVAWMAR